MGVAGADPKAVGLGRQQLVGRDQELERLRLFGMIDQIKAEACSHHQANGEGDRQRAKGGPR